MLPEWPRAHGAVLGSAILKQSPEDFVVEEQLDIEFSGEGEFDWLWVEKAGRTTEQVAKELARHAGVGGRDVAYAGLKDKQAVTRQWFSVHLPGKPSPDWATLAATGVSVLRSQRHQRKLRHGAHRGNRFSLCLREVDAEPAAIEQRLQLIAQRGVPNYFGEQRFGFDGDNLNRARAWLSGQARAPKRFQRGIYLSAARAWLFNQQLAERVVQGCWDKALGGEVFALEGSNSQFADDGDAALAQRLERGDIHPSAALPGRPGGLLPQGAAAAFEQRVLVPEAELCQGLVAQRVDAARRATRLMVQDLSWQLGEEGQLHLAFALPKGCFATVVVRELFDNRR